MENLYLTGGRQRRAILKSEEEWNLYERALILRVNPENNTSEICVDYQSPAEACASDGTPSFLFKAGTLEANRLYVPTSTEVLIYEVPGFKRIGYVSLPCFNDIHHVRPTPDADLLVVSTGLDMVVEVTLDGRVLREWSVLGGDIWERFSREIDYRKVATTKPHRSHPNFVFLIGKDIWVTRCHEKDAVCLTHPGQGIVLGTECVHDGHFYGGRIYFTRVDGNLIIVNKSTLQIEEVVDLKTINNESKALLGWCRGVLVLDESRIWVGFTRIRKTKFQEKINWVKHVGREFEKPTHIALYDIVAKKVLREIDLEQHGINIVYSIFPATEPCGMQAIGYEQTASVEPLLGGAQRNKKE